MKTPELLKAIESYPPDADWELLDDFGPHVEWTDAGCGCVHAVTFWNDEVRPRTPKCDDDPSRPNCFRFDGEHCCAKCGHYCGPFRKPTTEESETYG